MNRDPRISELEERIEGLEAALRDIITTLEAKPDGLYNARMSIAAQGARIALGEEDRSLML